MSTVKETVEVDVPIHTAYNQWTQFEEFPQFMEGVEEVRQVDARHNHWTMKVGGVKREFDTEIVDQLPDERITWRTTSGDTQQRGSVRFQRVDDTHTRVELVMDVEPSGAVEKVGDLVGTIDRRVKGDMKRFKKYIEERGAESGAWRGRIAPGATGGTPGGIPGGTTGGMPGGTTGGTPGGTTL
ncbi:SRPBCC family protein [Streptomyces sp. NPDC127190]|uniref:SRPBCC family protein n=1 Tax=unclassified Streptomyces TaxID=2593676 RepID=UPI003636DF6B